MKDGANFKDIPVSIQNYRTADAQTPNFGKDGPDGLSLVRRFPIIDKTSGVEYTGLAGQCDNLRNEKPQVITYLDDVKLIVEGKKGVSDQIYRPYLVLKYSQRRLLDLPISSAYQFSYASLYNLDRSQFWLVSILIFIFLSIIAGIIFLARMFIWTKYYPSSQAHLYPNRGTLLLVQILYTASQTFGFVYFFYLLMISLYWFFFFKLQDAVFCLLPSPSYYSGDYLWFYLLFFLTLGLVLISTFIMIIQQSKVDIFFIDYVSYQSKQGKRKIHQPKIYRSQVR